MPHPATTAAALLAAALLLPAGAGAQNVQTAQTAQAPPAQQAPDGRAGLEGALKNFPPLYVGFNVRPTAADEAVPRACPAAGGRVEQKGGPTIEFLGADPDKPTLCHLRAGSDTFDAWFGIWGSKWPGAAPAAEALDRLMHVKTGDAVGFDTVAGPGAQWHDVIRQDGVEEIFLLGKTYRAVKLAHYREGFGGNNYRSLSTLWKDLETGLPIYGTYQHIAGQPELDDPLIPTAIVPGS